MEVTRAEELVRAFVVTDDDMRSIVEAARSFLRDVREFECKIVGSDQAERTWIDVRKLCQYENPPSARILRIELRGASEDGLRQVSIEFGDKPLLGNVRVRLKSSGEESIQTLMNRLRYCMQVMRPWYARLAEANLVVMAFGLLMLLSIGGLITGVVSSLMSGGLSIERLLAPSGEEWSTVVVVMTLSFLVAWSLDQVRHRAFPRSTFAIGLGKNRHFEYDRIRKFFVGSVVVSGIVVGGSVAVIVNLLS